MADLLYKKFLITLCAVLLTCHGAFCYESSFPFPFEFGHSSDIYLDVKKETKEDRITNSDKLELLKDRKISTKPDDFVKYIKKGDMATLRLLLEAGFDPNMCINANYPIYYAARYNKKEVLHLLLEYGANPNKDFNSPIRYAILHKDYGAIKDLIDHGGDVNYLQMVLNETLLYTALKKKQYGAAILLLHKGAKIDNRSYVYIKKHKLEEKLGITLE